MTVKEDATEFGPIIQWMEKNNLLRSISMEKKMVIRLFIIQMAHCIIVENTKMMKWLENGIIIIHKLEKRLNPKIMAIQSSRFFSK
jgi:hypothetical protein